MSTAQPRAILVVMGFILIVNALGCRSAQGPQSPPRYEAIAVGPKEYVPLDVNGDGMICGREVEISGAMGIEGVADNESYGCPPGLTLYDFYSRRP